MIFQKSTSQATGEITQLKEEMATSRAEFEKKIKDLEAALATTSKDNAKLKKNLEEQEESWKTRLTSAEQKLGESRKPSKILPTGLVKWSRPYGVCFIKSLSYMPLSLHDNHYMLITIFLFS